MEFRQNVWHTNGHFRKGFIFLLCRLTQYSFDQPNNNYWARIKKRVRPLTWAVYIHVCCSCFIQYYGYGKDLYCICCSLDWRDQEEMVARAGEQKGGGGYSRGSDDLLCPWWGVEAQPGKRKVGSQSSSSPASQPLHLYPRYRVVVRWSTYGMHRCSLRVFVQVWIRKKERKAA